VAVGTSNIESLCDINQGTAAFNPEAHATDCEIIAAGLTLPLS